MKDHHEKENGIQVSFSSLLRSLVSNYQKLFLESKAPNSEIDCMRNSHNIFLQIGTYTRLDVQILSSLAHQSRKECNDAKVVLCSRMVAKRERETTRGDWRLDGIPTRFEFFTCCSRLSTTLAREIE